MKKLLALILIALSLFSALVSCNIVIIPTPSDPETEDPTPENPGGNNSGGDNTGGNNTGNNTGSNTGNNTGNNTGSNTGNTNSTLVPDENYTSKNAVFSTGVTEEDDFINLFSPDVLVEIDIDISGEQLALLQADYEHYSSFGSKSPIYRMANLRVKMTLPNGNIREIYIEEVGVRMKGNTSRTNFYNSNDGIYNLIHLKLDFGETFDDEEYYGSNAKVWEDSAARKARKNRTFATMEKIDLRWNKEDDATYIREIYSFDVYREMGVLAPHVNLASLDMGGVHLGVYTVNEPIDDIFLEKNLPENLLGGDLYKCGWGVNGGASFLSNCSMGIEDEDDAYFPAYDLKTNKKTSNHEALKNFITEMNKSGITKDKVASLIDIDNFTSFAAVSWFLGNPDDLRNNYNNYYVYFTPEGKAMFIPYDYDRTLGISHDWNPSGNGMTKDDPFTKNMGAGGTQKNPVYLCTVVSGGYYVQEYKEKLIEIANGTLFSQARFNDRYNRAKTLYSKYTNPSKDMWNDGGHHTYFDINITASPSDPNGNISYSDYIKLKLETLNKALGTTGGNISNGGNNNNNNGSDKVEITDYYIRADFTNWEVKSSYKMATTDGIEYTYEVKVTKENKLKVYDNEGGRWIGEESVNVEVSAEFTTDKHGNIVLGKGTYIIKYNAETDKVTIEKK